MLLKTVDRGGSLYQSLAHALSGEAEYRLACHLCDSDVKMVNIAFPKPPFVSTTQKGQGWVFDPALPTRTTVLLLGPASMITVKQLFLGHMSSTVPMRSLMVFALGSYLIPSVLGQAPATACGSSGVGAGCHSVERPSVSASINAHPLTTCTPPVTYVNGKLAICAQGTTLKELLRAVSFATGAVIEFPHDRAGEYISADISPGPVRDVLATLLNGSGLNYVMLGPQNNPSALQRLILRSAEPSTQGVPDQPPAQTAQVAPPAKLVSPLPPAPTSASTQAPAASVSPVQAAGIVPPKEPIAPEALGQMMRDLAQQIRGRSQNPQQNAPPPSPSQ